MTTDTPGVGDIRGAFGTMDIEVLDLPARGAETGERGSGDGRDPRLLAKRRGSLTRAMTDCAGCRNLPEWGMQVKFALLGPPLRYERVLDRVGIDMWEVSWLPSNACPTHRAEMMDAAGVEFILLWGVGAARWWREDADWFHGRIGTWGGRWIVMPWLGSDDYGPLEVWRDLVDGEVGVAECLAVECVKCGQGATWYDKDGMAWCGFHYPTSGR